MILCLGMLYWFWYDSLILKAGIAGIDVSWVTTVTFLFICYTSNIQNKAYSAVVYLGYPMIGNGW